jgi:hypothetical protein
VRHPLAVAQIEVLKLRARLPKRKQLQVAQLNPVAEVDLQQLRAVLRPVPHPQRRRDRGAPSELQLLELWANPGDDQEGRAERLDSAAAKVEALQIAAVFSNDLHRRDVSSEV